MTAMPLLMQLTSCAGTRVVERVVCPEILWPAFPVLGRCDFIDEGTANIDRDYLVRLAEYRIRIESEEEKYEAIKAMYGEDE